MRVCYLDSIFLFALCITNIAFVKNVCAQSETDLNIDMRLNAMFQDVLAAESKKPFWNSYRFNSGVFNREELEVSSVMVDESFTYGENVTAWNSLKLYNKHYIVGNTGNGIVTISFDNEGNYLSQSASLGFNNTVTAFTIFKQWNKFHKTMELIIVISVKNTESTSNIIWYRLKDDNVLEKFWSWSYNKLVTYLLMFNLHEMPKLLILNGKNNKDDNAGIDIFDFELDSHVKEFWLLQHISLQCSANISIITSVSNSLFLSVPQPEFGSVWIFKYHGNKFVIFQRIFSQAVYHISTFNIGFQHYLFISGFQSGLYRFTRNSIKQEAIVNANFAKVTNSLAVPVKTYRDEIILLVQHVVKYDSHTNSLVDAIVYHNKSFIVHDEVPCIYYGNKEHGLSCLVEYNDYGLEGSVSIPTDNYTKLIIPRLHSQNSELFLVKSKLIPVKNPVQEQIGDILVKRNAIMKMISDRGSVIAAAKKILKPTKKVEASKVDKSTELIFDFLKGQDSSFEQIVNFTQSEYDENHRDEYYINQIRQSLSIIEDVFKDVKVLIKDAIPLNSTNLNFTQPFKLVGKMSVHGEIIVKNMSVNLLNGVPTKELFENVVSLKDLETPITGLKTIKNITAKEAIIDAIDDLNTEAMLYKNGNGIHIHGDLIFEQPVNIAENINLPNNGLTNEVDLSEDVFRVDKLFIGNVSLDDVNITGKTSVLLLNGKPVPKSLKDISNYTHTKNNANINYKTVEVIGHINAETINGKNITELFNEICLTNKPCLIPKILSNKIKSNVDTTITCLNNIPFPSGYLFMKDTPVNISGKKIFTGTVYIHNHGQISGLMDGIDLNKAVTLKTDQYLSGNYAFSDLEVIGNFSVKGSILGQGLDEFAANPTLLDTLTINSEVIFKDLIVDGTISVDGLLNKTTWDEYLGDVIYKYDKNVIINSIKEFNNLTVLKGVTLTSNVFNDKDISSYVTKNTHQVLNQNVLNGIATFVNMTLGGLYDGINVTHLDLNSVKLSGNQVGSADLIFMDQDIVAAEVEIKDQLNGISVDDFLSTFNNYSIVTCNESVVFEHLEADVLNVTGDLEIIQPVELDVEIERFSKSTDQDITEHFNIEIANISQLNVERINGVPVKKLGEILHFLDNISEQKLNVTDMYVKGNITSGSINEHENIATIFENSFRTKEINNFTGNIKFLKNATVEKININSINNVNFDDAVRDIVLGDESTVVLFENKVFNKGVHAYTNINASRINGIRFSDILIKSANQTIHRPVHINGSVAVENNLNVTGHLNEISISKTLDRIKMVDNNTFVLFGDASFLNKSQIKQIFIGGLMNGINLRDTLKNIVKINGNFNFKRNITFTNKVSFMEDLTVFQNFNGISLSQQLDNIAFLNKDTVINGSVIFESDMLLFSRLFANQLNAKTLSECSVEEWKANAVYLNNSTSLPGSKLFENIVVENELIVDYINDVNMNTLIPLRKNQTINATLEFLEVKTLHDISVGSTVNKLDLEKESENTLMTVGDQEIFSHVIFHENVTVKGNIKTTGLVNNLDLRKIITTDTDQDLNATYIFNGTVTLKKKADMFAGSLNNIDVNDWNRKSVFETGNESQIITGKINIKGNASFQNDISGSGFIKDLDVVELLNEKQHNILEQKKLQFQYNANYSNVCKKTQNALSMAKFQVYMFQYLDVIQKISVEFDIRSIHHVHTDSKDYILISYMQSCVGDILEWSPHSREFIRIASADVGLVEQWVTVKDNGTFYIVTRSAYWPGCSHNGANIWLLNDPSLTFMFKLIEAIELRESLKPATFYVLIPGFVVEYNIEDMFARSATDNRRWIIKGGANMTFVPPEVGMGLSLSDGREIIQLKTKESKYTNERSSNGASDFNVTSRASLNLPSTGEAIVINAGAKSHRKKLIAVSSHEYTSVKGKLDFIKIYENVIEGKLFHKVPTYKPSSLNSLEFDENGQSFLIFLEDYKAIQIYEYKGIDGFKHHSSARIDGSKLISMSLPLPNHVNKQKILVLVNGNELIIIQAIMTGNTLHMDDLKCKK